MLSLALSVLSCLGIQDEAARPGGLPLQVPAGWEGKKQDGAFVLLPKDLREGEIYNVVVPELTGKVGSLKGLLDAGKASLNEVGTFKPARSPARARNDGGWEYQVVIGTIEKDGGTVMGQVVALESGEEEGLILLVSDSVATMEKYSDAFSAMVRSIGATKAKATAPPAGPLGKVDLGYTTPEGYETKQLEGGVLLTRTIDTREFRILILPTQKLEGSLRDTFLEFWAQQIKPTIETSIVPLPLVRRMKSGMAVAFDQDPAARNKNGVQHHGGLYLLARGTRCVPIMGLYFNLGSTKELEQDLDLLFESAVIPGAGAEKVSLLDAAELVGDWGNSSSSLANYVTASGAYAGDASIATGSSMLISGDATYRKSLIAITRERRIKEADEGKWRLEDNELVFVDKKSADGAGKRYRVFGVGADPKAGSFLVLSSYSDTPQQADLAYPRRLFGGDWFKRRPVVPAQREK